MGGFEFCFSSLNLNVEFGAVDPRSILLQTSMPAAAHVGLEEISMIAHRTLMRLFVVVNRLDVLTETVGSFECLVALIAGVFVDFTVRESMLVEVLWSFEGFTAGFTIVGFDRLAKTDLNDFGDFSLFNGHLALSTNLGGIAGFV